MWAQARLFSCYSGLCAALVCSTHDVFLKLILSRVCIWMYECTTTEEEKNDDDDDNVKKYMYTPLRAPSTCYVLWSKFNSILIRICFMCID